MLFGGQMNRNVLLVFTLIALTCMQLFAQKHEDPTYLQIISTDKSITIDGKLDETEWDRRYDYLVFGAGAKPGDVNYTVTDEVFVTGNHTDSTLTQVYMMHNGLDLYFGIKSNDESVGKFGNSWEGDGLFMKIKTASGVPLEFKLYFNAAGENPEIVFESAGPEGSGEAVAWKPESTIVNDTTAADSGYTAEMVLHLDKLGYTNLFSEVEIMISVFDPDGYVDDMDPYAGIGSYYKSYWGSEWGDEFRKLKLADPKTKIAYATNDDINLDGELNESFWEGAEEVTIGKGSGSSTGGYYQQYSHETNIYEDQSMATVKFIHKGTDLYIGIESDDKSVCKWSPGWEADGLFLWMTNKGIIAPTERMEIKNMYFSGTEGEGAVFEMNDNVPTDAAEGASFEPDGTVTHTETNGEDAGYSMEVVVHTDLFGYEIGDTVMLSAVIWDIDDASVDAWTDSTADYAPNWWGTQWADPTFEKYAMYRGVILSPNITGTGDEKTSMPDQFELKQNYPNPFNPSTTIEYTIPFMENVELEIFNVLGSKVATLVNERQAAGSYKINWNASNISSGVYFVKLRAGKFLSTSKMLLLK